MKKLIFSLLFLSGIIAEQNVSAQLFEAGPIIGFNGTQIAGDQFQGFRKVGLHAGVGADVNIAEKFSVGLELLYSQRGSRFVPSALDSDDDDQEEYFMDYLEIPLIVKYHDIKGMDFGAGLSFGRSMRNVYKRNGFDESDEIFGVPNVDNNIDISAFGDATYNINRTFRVGFRWAFSVPNVKVNGNRIGRHNVVTLRLLTYFGARQERSNL